MLTQVPFGSARLAGAGSHARARLAAPTRTGGRRGRHLDAHADRYPPDPGGRPGDVPGHRRHVLHHHALPRGPAAVRADPERQPGERTIKGATHYDMLENRREDLHRQIRNIGELKQDGIQKVRLFNKEGRIMFSSEREEIGTVLDARAEACYHVPCRGQAAGKLDIQQRARIFRAPDGSRILGIINPIPNEPSCWTADCHAHSPQQKVLGVLDVNLSMVQADRADPFQPVGAPEPGGPGDPGQQPDHLVAQPAPGAAPGGGPGGRHPAGGGRGPHHGHPGDGQPRAGGPGQGLQRHDPEHVRDPAPAHPGRQAGLRGPARRRHRPRDQQPAHRRPHLCLPPGQALRRRGARPARTSR